MAKPLGSMRGPNGEEINPLEHIGIGADTLSRLGQQGETIKWGAGAFINGAGGKSSIIGMARHNVFEFPVFISNTVSLEYATAINSLLEQVYASYLQMAVSVNPVVDYTTVRERQNYSQFSKFKTNTTKYIECVDLSYQKDSCHAEYFNEDANIHFEFNMLSIEDSDAAIINEAVDYQPLSEFDHYFQEGGRGGGVHPDWSTEEREAARTEARVNNYVDPETGQNRYQEDRTGARTKTKLTDEQMKQAKRDYDKCVKLEEEVNAFLNRDDSATGGYTVKEKHKLFGGKNFDEIKARQAVNDSYISMGEYRDMKSLQAAKDEFMLKYRMTYDSFKLNADVEDNARKNAKDRREAMELNYKMKSTKAPEFIDENKIKKMNTMKPLMMAVTMNIMADDGTVSHPMEYIVGVKTHCRVIDHTILPEVVKYPMKEMDKITRKAKWRAGELKFFRDIVFHIKEKKQTAIDTRDPSRKWYRRLYELAHMKGDGNVSRMIAGQGSTHGLIPNAAIVISRGDVDYIEEATGIDMLKGSNAKKLCEELFLINFIVVDIDKESIHIMTPDINNDYETQSLAAVNKQIAELDTAGKSTRDVFKMLK